MSTAQVLDSDIFMILAQGLKHLNQDIEAGTSTSLRQLDQVAQAFEHLHQEWIRAATAARTAQETRQRQHQSAAAERARRQADQYRSEPQNQPSGRHSASGAALLQSAVAQEQQTARDLAQATDQARRSEAGLAEFRALQCRVQERLARHLQTTRHLKQTVDQEVAGAVLRLAAKDQRIQAYLQN